MRNVFIFFFKQKTAYEIRNCDWSSDVCSSDLADPADFYILPDIWKPDQEAFYESKHSGQGAHAFEIGRASCRERV